MKRCLSLFLAGVLISSTCPPVSPASAADDSITIVQIQLQLTNDANGNNIANIGDQVTIAVGLNNADGGCGAQGTTVTANLQAYGGGAAQNIPCVADNGGVNDTFVFQFNITNAAGNGIDVAAANAASQVLITATDNDENGGAGNPNPQQSSNPLGDGGVDVAATGGVDTISPQVTDGAITATLSVDAGVANVGGINDVVLVTYTPITDGINDPNPNEIRANLTAIGGAGNQQLFDNGTNGDVANADGTFSYAFSITPGAIDNGGLAVGIAMEDDAGNNSGAPVNDGNTFTIDNVAPTVTDGAITSTLTNDVNGNGTVNIGDTIRTIWDNSGGGDNNIDTINAVTADLSAFGGSNTQLLYDDGSNGDQAGGNNIYTFDLVVQAGAINATNQNASVSAVDNAGNTTTTLDTSSNLTVKITSGGGGTRFFGSRRSDDSPEPNASSAEQEETPKTDDDEQVFEYDSNDNAIRDPIEPDGDNTATPQLYDERDLVFEEVSSLLSENQQEKARGYANDIVGHEDEVYIYDLYERRVVSGVAGSEEFKPEEKLTKAALLKIALNGFNIYVDPFARQSSFWDVNPNQWYAAYFATAEDLDIITGTPAGKAEPEKFVNLAEALTILFRAGNIDTSLSTDYQTEDLKQADGKWFHNVFKFAHMNGILPDGAQSSGLKEITRGEMAEITSLTIRVKQREPCNCDQEFQAWKDAKKKAQQAQKDADIAKEESDKAADEAKKANDAMKEAQDKVTDLEAFFDDDSSVTYEGKKITRGDLALLRETSKAIYDGWVSGDATAQETSEAWRENNKDKLEELREKKAEELDDARDELNDAIKKANDAQKKADDAKTKADQAQEDADDAANDAEAKKKEYEDCTVRCNELKKKLAEEAKRREEARRRAEEKRRAEAKRKAAEQRREEARRKAEADRKAREAAAATSSSNGGDGGTPPAAKDPCEEKLKQAIATHGKNTAEAFPEYAESVSSTSGRTARTVTTGVASAIKAATKAAYTGASTAAQIAKAVGAVIPAAYKLWVDYVGDKIKAAGMQIVANRRYCNYIKYSTTGVCGYEVFKDGSGRPTRTVYWQKGADGKYKVIIMGPKDAVQEGSCE